MTAVKISLPEIHALTTRVLLSNGLESNQADPVADIITRAEADECRSHGLYRVEGYIASLRSGRVKKDAQPSVSTAMPGVVKVDGNQGFAPAAAQAGRAALLGAVKANGIAAMALGNCHHFSALWADIEPLVTEGLVVWCFVVGQCSVAPYGGTRRLMGTNPIGFGWPRPNGLPFVFDFATSATARGEVELKKLAGSKLPQDWALDPDGQPTTDPEQALAGALLPFGGHKGSALSMMVELIAGPLIGEMTSREVAVLPIHDGGPPPGGELFIAMDVGALDKGSTDAAEAFFAEACRQPGVRLPSERRYLARKESQAGGVDVPEQLLRRIEALIVR